MNVKRKNGVGIFTAITAVAGTLMAAPEQVYFIAAHPDDMIGPAALALTLSENDRFQIHVVDYTRGGKGLAGQSVEATERIRTAEEMKVCALLGVKPVFIDEPDGSACAGAASCEKLVALFRQEPPRAVITHWPLDEHADHVMCYAAVMNAIRLAGLKRRPELYFFEESIQTRSMPIRYYLPFGQKMMDRKLALVRCYACQNDGDQMAERKLGEAKYHGWKTPQQGYAEPYGAFFPHLPGQKTIFDELGAKMK